MEILAVSPTVATDLTPELATWQADTSGLVVNTDAATVAALRADVQPHAPTSLFLLDQLPTVYRVGDSDNHGSRPLPNDPALFPGVPVGRLDYSRLAGVDPIAAYKAYFARLHDYRVNGSRLPLKLNLYDNFTNQHPEFARNVRSQFQRLPADLISTHTAVEISRALPSGPGPALFAGPSMFHVDMSGGMNPSWLWQEGSEPDFVAHPIQSYFASIFGSFMVDTDKPNSLIRACMTWALSCVYDWQGQFAWSYVLAGMSVGEAALVTAGNPATSYTTVYGDPTLRLEPGMVDLISVLPEVYARLNAVEKDVAAIKAGNSSGQTGPPTPGPTPGPTPTPVFLPEPIQGPPMPVAGPAPGFTGSSTWPLQRGTIAPADGSTTPASVLQQSQGGSDFTFKQQKPGATLVRLHMCEPAYRNAPGMRPTDIYIQGVKVKDSWDPLRDGGASFKEIILEFPVVPDAAGEVSVRLVQKGREKPCVSLIEVP